MPKKASSLLDEIKKLPDRTPGKKGDWFDDLKRRKPEVAREVDEIVRLWTAGDATLLSKFPNQYQLAGFFVNKLAEHSIRIKPGHFSEFIRKRKAGA